MNLNVKFKDYDVKIPSYTQPSRDDSSVVALSFGKDSLLTWAVCKEIGLNPQITYIVEPLLLYEEKHKDLLAKDFEREFKVKLYKIIHTTGHLRDGVRLGVGKTELGWGLQNTSYFTNLSADLNTYYWSSNDDTPDPILAYFFLNPASPTRPEARRSMVAGSGTGATSPSRTAQA